MRPTVKKLAALTAAATLTLSMAACGGDSGSGKDSKDGNSAQSEGWPRTIKHEKGELELDAKPENIASTSVTVTGALLAIDAPVTSSAATGVSPITDKQGFFGQWSDVAKERDVDVLYPNLEFSMDALYAQDPDLVIVSTSGADSVLDHYDEIAEEFPTIVVDYSNQTWEDLATELGDATGNEDGAKEAIEDFDNYVEEAAEKIEVPEGKSSIVSYNGPGGDQTIGLPTGPHAQLLKQLGIDVVGADSKLDTNQQKRDDFIFITYENLTEGIEGDNVFLLTGDEKKVDTFKKDKTVANLDAVKNDHVYPLGLNSFRIDYYSGKELVDEVVKSFE
ncbi:MAG: Fe2+-enterobactin ABC transporter substrate-binding protein [Galactobacter sp.]